MMQVIGPQALEIQNGNQIQSLCPPDVQNLAGQTDVHTDDHGTVRASTKSFPAPVQASCAEGCGAKEIVGIAPFWKSQKSMWETRVSWMTLDK